MRSTVRRRASPAPGNPRVAAPEAPRPVISRRGLLKATLHTMIGCTLAGIGMGVYATKVEPGWLKPERIRVALPKLPVPFDGYRIVQLTDLHLGFGTRRETIARAVQIALDFSPDLIVLTGDYVSRWLDAPALHAELSRLTAPGGVWAIMGNHEHWVDVSGVRQVLEDAAIPELPNAAVPLRRGSQDLWLAGVDDVWERHHDLDAALSEIPPGAFTIVLAHEPDFADRVTSTGRVALQLSGHSHGGQLRTPWGDAPFAPYLGRKYPYGLRRVGEMWLYTSRGVGQNETVRFNCRPEVTEITLVRG